MPVVKHTSRDPIALHWPVIENGADPARPILPVSKARLQIAFTVPIDQVVADQNVRDAIEQREIRPGLERKMKIGHHRRFRDPGIRDDQSLILVCFEVLAENRVVIREIRADQEHDVGGLHVFVVTRRAIAAQ